MDILEQLEQDGINISDLPPELDEDTIRDIDSKIKSSTQYLEISPEDPDYELMKDFVGVSLEEFSRLWGYSIDLLYEALDKNRDNNNSHESSIR